MLTFRLQVLFRFLPACLSAFSFPPRAHPFFPFSQRLRYCNPHSSIWHVRCPSLSPALPLCSQVSLRLHCSSACPPNCSSPFTLCRRWASVRFSTLPLPLSWPMAESIPNTSSPSHSA